MNERFFITRCYERLSRKLHFFQRIATLSHFSKIIHHVIICTHLTRMTHCRHRFLIFFTIELIEIIILVIITRWLVFTFVNRHPALRIIVIGKHILDDFTSITTREIVRTNQLELAIRMLHRIEVHDAHLQTIHLTQLICTMVLNRLTVNQFRQCAIANATYNICHIYYNIHELHINTSP